MLVLGRSRDVHLSMPMDGIKTGVPPRIQRPGTPMMPSTSITETGPRPWPESSIRLAKGAISRARSGARRNARPTPNEGRPAIIGRWPRYAGSVRPSSILPFQRPVPDAGKRAGRCATRVCHRSMRGWTCPVARRSDYRPNCRRRSSSSSGVPRSPARCARRSTTLSTPANAALPNRWDGRRAALGESRRRRAVRRAGARSR